MDRIVWCICVSVSLLQVISCVVEEESTTTTTTTRVLHKCCKSEEFLHKFINSEGEATYKCLELDNDTSTLPNPLVMYGNGVLQHGFVNCNTELVEVMLYLDIPTPFNSCVDKLVYSNESDILFPDGVLVALRCDDPVEVTLPTKVTTLHMCCPDDLVYNTSKHMCANNTNAELVNNFLGPDPFLVDKYVGLTTCHNAVLREYNSGMHKFTHIVNELRIEGSSGAQFIPAGQFCINAGTEGQMVARVCHKEVQDVCGKIPCVKKCCPDGKSYLGKKCNESYLGFNPTFHSAIGNETLNSTPPIAEVDEYGIIYGDICKEIFILVPEGDITMTHFLRDTDGKVVAPFYDDPIYNHDMYCIEEVFFPEYNMFGSRTFLCLYKSKEQVELDHRLHLAGIGLCISCVFLSVTALVYVFVPQLMNLHGKTLTCHVTSLICSSTCLAYAQFHTSLPKQSCTALGYCIYFSFLIAFSWLNVMCFDIWLTFGSVRQVGGMRKRQECKRFAWYSLYAYGFPVFMTGITLIIDLNNLYPESYDPSFGKTKCWFSNINAHLIHFILPMILQCCSNIGFFYFTAKHCAEVKSEINRMQDHNGEAGRKFKADKDKMMMTLKLFIVMGISWLPEFLSAVITNPVAMWYAFDCVNSLQGIPIFCIFVLKKKVLSYIKHRLGMEKNRRTSRTTMATASTSVDSHHSRRISSSTNLHALCKTPSGVTINSTTANMLRK